MADLTVTTAFGPATVQFGRSTWTMKVQASEESPVRINRIDYVEVSVWIEFNPTRCPYVRIRRANGGGPTTTARVVICQELQRVADELRADSSSAWLVERVNTAEELRRAEDRRAELLEQLTQADQEVALAAARLATLDDAKPAIAPALAAA